MNKIEAFRKFLVDGLGFPDDDKAISEILWNLTGTLREDDLNTTYDEDGYDSGIKSYCDAMPCMADKCKDCPYDKFWHQEYKRGWDL